MARIGLVVHGQPPELVGGTERLVADLAGALAARGDQVEVFTGSIEWREHFGVVRDESGPVPLVRVHRHDLFFERWDKVHDPFVERAFLAWLAHFAPDVVHVHHWARLTTTLVACCRRLGVPVVVTLHDLFSSCPRYHRVKADLSFCRDAPGPEVCRHCAPRWSFQSDAEIDASVGRFATELRDELRGADALVAPTAGHGRRVLEWLGLDEGVGPVHAVPPASTPNPSPATRPLGDAVASAARPLAVGVFGHLHPTKGLGVLLAAQAGLADPSVVQLHVWGAAPTPDMDAEWRAQAGDRQVTWHGAYEPEDLSGAPVDVVVLPTLCCESYSFALDEAGALGVPILFSDLGALADRRTGRMLGFPRGDAAALARELQRLADDPAARSALAAAPAPTVIDMATHLQRLDAVYAAARAAPRRAGAAAPDLAAGRAADPAADPAEDRALDAREHAFLLREAGLKELLRSEGWESVVARLQAEIDAARGGPASS